VKGTEAVEIVEEFKVCDRSQKIARIYEFRGRCRHPVETTDASGETQTEWRLGKIHSVLVVAENMHDAAVFLNRQQPVFVPEYAVLRGAVQT
jgi:hypothetical protein